MKQVHVQQALFPPTAGSNSPDDTGNWLATEGDLVAAAYALGADTVGPLSQAELAIVRSASPVSSRRYAVLRELFHAGLDPLGVAFSRLRAPETRRLNGATYTPSAIVQTMIDWAAKRSPERVVDPGVGSARFLVQAGKRFPRAQLVGIDIDPLAALMSRANLAMAGMADRSRVVLGDFRQFAEEVDGQTLYLGNPPYVRHHLIEPQWKQWLHEESVKLGLSASKLAGLHIYFFLATALHAKPGDSGAFVTAAEWLDVNYGSILRALVLGRLGGQSITVIEPTAQPFPDAASTAAITTFEVGSEPKAVFVQRVTTLDKTMELGCGTAIPRDRLATEPRWSHLTLNSTKPPEGYVALGDLFRVHRGAVTGANEVWIAGDHSIGLPESVLFPTVTRAREILDSGGVLLDASRLRNVIDLPVDLDELDDAERKLVEKFLITARRMGGSSGYIAQHRKAWWSVGLRTAAPIVSTYMARRPPAFALNQADARHINIAHGLYPREAFPEALTKAIVDYLQSNISQSLGRTYAGGLTKFEPREMERLLVPGPQMLVELAAP